MSVIEMAKAHLQNVNQRIEELTSQKSLLQDEINKLSAYVSRGLEEIKSHESEKLN
jgi:hypothetical protein